MLQPEVWGYSLTKMSPFVGRTYRKGYKLFGSVLCQPIEIHDGVSTLRLGKDLECGFRNSVGTMFTTDDQDRTVGQHQSGRVPPPTLES
jgi:hypothetical protein